MLEGRTSVLNCVSWSLATFLGRRTTRRGSEPGLCPRLALLYLAADGISRLWALRVPVETGFSAGLVPTALLASSVLLPAPPPPTPPLAYPET